MNIYTPISMEHTISSSTYPGRGIITGCSEDGKSAVIAYFIMGRSENSRNRVIKKRQNGEVYTAAFDESKVKDPTLIIYNAVREQDQYLIVTNGDQTDTIFNYLQSGMSFADALRTRTFEPDGPIFTPRISALLTFHDGTFSVKQGLLKSADPEGRSCNRCFYEFPKTQPGTGRLIHTYDNDGDPVPTFTGEPKLITVCGNIDAFTSALWNALNQDNKISLYVRFIDLATGKADDRIVNKNQ